MTRVSLLLAALALPATPAAAAECKLGILADLPVTMQGMRASVPVKINTIETRLWLDSGAFFSIMPKAKAIELGLKIGAAPFGLRLVGIGGDSSTDLVTVKTFGIADKSLTDVQFLVGGSDVGNGLIGRNLLAIADTEFDLAGGSVKLIRPHDCNTTAIAYWAAGKPFFTAPLEQQENPQNRMFRVTVRINGVAIEGEYDSGAPNTLLSRRAAEKAGIALNGPNVTPIRGIGGFGRRSTPGWAVPVESVAIGDETILKTRLDVIDGPITASSNAPDMLIGADYMLAHHIYVARGQRRIYFTYSGGKPFRSMGSTPVSTASAGAPLPADIHRVAPVTDSAAPKTADEFARRASARIAQHAFPGAIDDLTRAITLAPDHAEYYRDRALAYQAGGQRGLARTDIERALQLAPNDGALLRIRAILRMRERDSVGALADADAAARATPATSLEMLPIASLLARLDQPGRAVALLGPVIASHQEDSALPRLLNARCWIRAQAGIDLDAALDDCTRALKRAGKQPMFLDSRGLVELRMGNPTAAITDYDAALAINPKLAWSLYGRGLAKIALGQKDAGEADKTAAIALYPDIVAEAKRFHVIP
ncbi:aspartyl protease family protein [Sphingomonas sp. H39-1-10]|uniref:aspartyl protease family protein n=1 Tax=Sphingomonas pollutisoli TaxID=3030829 RepID=UPI0023B9FB83|nr:aspartyl protease family protein [Sphingomonas pollutisoli]MDF0488775.1 aspartyl protease family protein [Sphingomonas pollutisoli]